MERLLEFSANHPFLMMAAVMLTLLVLFHEIRARGRGRVDLSPADAVKLINAGALVLDVRSADEYQASHINSAKHVAAADIAEKAGDFAKHKTKPVLVCCAHGHTAGRAAATLRKLGFEQVFNLQGGLTAWLREHLPVTSGGKGK